MAEAGGMGARTPRRSRATSPTKGRPPRPTASRKEGEKESPPEGAPICSVAFCPICMAVTAFGDARPDLVQHLLVAGREMLLAVRALIDARLEAAQDRPAKLERLTIE